MPADEFEALLAEGLCLPRPADGLPA